MSLAGYASINSARVCFRPLHKKLAAFVDGVCKDGVTNDNDKTNTTDGTGAQKPNKSCYETTEVKTRGRPKKRKLGVNDEPNETSNEAHHASRTVDSKKIVTASFSEPAGCDAGSLAFTQSTLGNQGFTVGAGSPEQLAFVGRYELYLSAFRYDQRQYSQCTR